MILLDASTHAREHMTTNVLMEMIDQYTVAYANKSNFGKYNVRSVLSNVAIWFVPMVNADGVNLVQYGPTAIKDTAQVKKLMATAQTSVAGKLMHVVSTKPKL